MIISDNYTLPDIRPQGRHPSPRLLCGDTSKDGEMKGDRLWQI